MDEKYQIIEAYLEAGGAKGIEIAMEAEDEEDESFNSRMLEQLTDEQKQEIEQQFNAYVEQQPQILELIGESNPDLMTKY